MLGLKYSSKAASFAARLTFSFIGPPLGHRFPDGIGCAPIPSRRVRVELCHDVAGGMLACTRKPEWTFVMVGRTGRLHPANAALLAANAIDRSLSISWPPSARYLSGLARGDRRSALRPRGRGAS